MKKYKVVFREVFYETTMLEAESKSEAEDKAYDALDAGDVIIDRFNGYTEVEVIEVDPDNKV